MRYINEDNMVGCILGGAIGDAIAGPYEGRVAPIVYDDQLEWRISDDTQLTLATCEAIVKTKRVDPAAIAESFRYWFIQRRITGIGASTLKALRDLAHGNHWALAGRRGEYAAGNGAAMRIAPVALALDSRQTDTRQIIRDVCIITHNNDEAYTGALAISHAINMAVTEQWTPGMPLLKPVASDLPDTVVRDRLRAIMQSSTTVGFQEIGQHFGSGGYVAESVPMALLAVERFLANGYDNMIMECIALGGDTDTIASMAGHIAGAFIGRRNLPTAWLHRLPDREYIATTAQKLAATISNEPRGTPPAC